MFAPERVAMPVDRPRRFVFGVGAMYTDTNKSSRHDDSPVNPIRRGDSLVNHDKDACMGSFTVQHMVVSSSMFQSVGGSGFNHNYDIILTVSLL